ncbi:hypothetical protein EHQ52_09955 [Leptospira koniambonensis]|uniref:Uncharacterized protein n=1 Tax=Leptospira koniambonensis TaxID=2484950 RepID=A0A4R9J993_9LEPT|nr:hypothetical protein [Leptospira koniambonensis]TGL34808.1 hypothetical protein EHQ52_09955 [Leptospira koniambonensis]
MQSFEPVGCVSISDLKNTNTPADLLPGTRLCLEKDDFEHAVELFAVAGIYGRFDILRVNDKTAHQAITVLLMNNLTTLDADRKKAFQDYMKNKLQPGSNELLSLCNRVKLLGPPKYNPVYMLQHGISAFSGIGGGLKTDFDPTFAWNSSLSSYLHCP